MIAEEIYDIGLESDHWSFRGRRTICEKLLRQYIDPITPGDKRPILDVGCGIGGNMIWLKKFGSVVGVEADIRAVEQSRQRGLTTVHGDFMELQGKGRYSVVAALDVLEHVPNDLGAVRQIAEHLRPGGLFLCTVPAMPSLWSDHDEDLGHYRRYTQDHLKLALENAFIQPLYIGHFNSLLLPLVYLRKFSNGGPMTMPHRLINAVCHLALRLESRVIGPVSFPVGSSLVALGAKHL